MRTGFLAVLAGLVGSLAGCIAPPPAAEGTPTPAAEAAASDGAGRAIAEIRNAYGDRLGVVRLEQTAAGVRIRGELSGLPAGAHGFHIHDVGRCERPRFESAGDHFNPLGRRHGMLDPAGPHAGDLRNLLVPASGVAQIDLITTSASLTRGEPTYIFDNDGASLLIHAEPDDYRSDPSGNAGARIACGVIAPA